MTETVKVEVMWDLEVDGEVLPFEEAPAIIQEVPRDVYDASYKEDGLVEDWLSDETGFCVKNWRLV